MKRILIRLVTSSILALLLYIVIVLVYGWATDWQPEGRTELTIDQPAAQSVITDSILHIISWNVGYSGLGAESDFSFDDEGIWLSGSSMVRSPRPLVEKYLSGSINFLKKTPADIYLLQEVDVASDRSYRIPQYTEYQKVLPGYAATMALNYKVDRVPIPILEPWKAYGRVRSGLGTFSKYQPVEAVRDQLPGHYAMPGRLFQLDRCAGVHRFKTRFGHDLVVIHLHNAAYDPGDKIKAVQLPHLRKLAEDAYNQGAYVVLGGDWNQSPPNFKADSFRPKDSEAYVPGNVPIDFLPEDWVYAYDPTQSTNRSAKDPYVKYKTAETLLDYFVVSPNLRVRTVKTMDENFQNSDHQPVLLEIELLKQN